MTDDMRIDVDDPWRAARNGVLLAWMEAYCPRERWALDVNDGGTTLLHLACMGPNANALVVLLAHGLDVNARASFSTPALLVARNRGSALTMTLLCAGGADLLLRNKERESALDICVREKHKALTRVLLVNGARLATVRADYQCRIKPWMVALEGGRVRCRVAAVTISGYGPRLHSAWLTLSQLEAAPRGRHESDRPFCGDSDCRASVEHASRSCVANAQRPA